MARTEKSPERRERVRAQKKTLTTINSSAEIDQTQAPPQAAFLVVDSAAGLLVGIRTSRYPDAPRQIGGAP